MNKTKIEYLDYTWNSVTGCTPVSTGCDHCWARRMHERGLWGKQPFSEIQFHPDRLDEPLRRKKPARIGVCFMSDIFNDEIADEFRDKIFAVMALSPQHTFLLLTKRAERMQRYCEHQGTPFRVAQTMDTISVFQLEPWQVREIQGRHSIAHENAESIARVFDISGSQVRNILTGKQWTIESPFIWPLKNCWAGISVEDQKTVDERIPLLLQTAASIRFASVEPMLGPVKFEPVCDITGTWGIDWVICGAESGPAARGMNPQWARSIRDQCRAAGVPFFMKQMSGREAIPDDLRIHEFPK